jgi:hypothetical protein
MTWQDGISRSSWRHHFQQHVCPGRAEQKRRSSRKHWGTCAVCRELDLSDVYARLQHPHAAADPSRPLTNKTTTPSTVVILKFSLSADGTYKTAAGRGHYTFDARTKALTWLDGPHEKRVTKTELGERENGAPKMGFTLNKRPYGCFMPKSQP